MDFVFASILFLVAWMIFGLSVGLPIYILPFPALCALGLVLFYETRSLKDFALFVVGVAVSLGGVLYTLFGHLEENVQGIPLSTMCMLMLITVLVVVFIPGLLLADQDKYVIGTCFSIASILFALIEEHLHKGNYLKYKTSSKNKIILLKSVTHSQRA